MGVREPLWRLTDPEDGAGASWAGRTREGLDDSGGEGDQDLVVLTEPDTLITGLHV